MSLILYSIYFFVLLCYLVVVHMPYLLCCSHSYVFQNLPQNYHRN